MALKKKPVTGMKDILPQEMQIRDYVLNQIKETYRGFGFSSIETPCVEHIENLLSKQGGDNEKLIFKIFILFNFFFNFFFCCFTSFDQVPSTIIFIGFFNPFAGFV